MAQTAQNTVRIPVLNDHSILALFNHLAKIFEGTAFRIDLPNATIGTFHSSESFFEQYGSDGWDQSFLFSLVRATLAGTQLTVTFSRKVSEFEGSAVRSAPSNWENEIAVTHSDNITPDPSHVLSVWTTIDEFRIKFEAKPRTTKSTSSEFEKFAAKQLAALSELHTKIVRDAEATRLNIEQESARQKGHLEDEWKERRSLLDQEFKQKLDEVKVESEKLTQREKELDDRGHMHARRQLRADITRDIKERLLRPSVSGQSNRLRMVVGALTGGGALTLGLYALYAAVDLHVWLSSNSTVTPLLYVLAARFALAAGGAFGLLMYLLSWIKNIHNDDVKSERDLERYRYDIDRASWVIETILEAKDKESAAVPELWVEGVTRNLFPRSEGRAEEADPLAALGSLLNVAAEAELSPGGTKIKIGRSGLRKIGKAPEA